MTKINLHYDTKGNKITEMRPLLANKFDVARSEIIHTR